MRAGRGSRPRTRTRPAHADAADGVVTAVDRGRYAVLVGGRAVAAMRARELGRRAVVVGDRVSVVGDTDAGPDTLVRIVRIAARSSVLRRSGEDDDPMERVMIANADQLVVVVALADPPPRTGLIDRCLVAAYDGGLDPLLCLTKSDLAAPDELLALYGPLDVPAVAVDRSSAVPALLPLLAGRTSVLVGHSGVGKSTLVNALVPDALRSVGGVNVVTGRGRHTSSSAVALPLPADAGWVVDTPGVRSFGLAHVSPATVVATFPDAAEAAQACPPGCPHRSAADGCALDAALEPARLASLRRLLRVPDVSAVDADPAQTSTRTSTQTSAQTSTGPPLRQ